MNDGGEVENNKWRTRRKAKARLKVSEKDTRRQRKATEKTRKKKDNDDKGKDKEREVIVYESKDGDKLIKMKINITKIKAKKTKPVSRQRKVVRSNTDDLCDAQSWPRVWLGLDADDEVTWVTIYVRLALPNKPVFLSIHHTWLYLELQRAFLIHQSVGGWQLWSSTSYFIPWNKDEVSKWSLSIW